MAIPLSNCEVYLHRHWPSSGCRGTTRALGAACPCGAAIRRSNILSGVLIGSSALITRRMWWSDQDMECENINWIHRSYWHALSTARPFALPAIIEIGKLSPVINIVAGVPCISLGTVECTSFPKVDIDHPGTSCGNIPHGRSRSDKLVDNFRVVWMARASNNSCVLNRTALYS